MTDIIRTFVYKIVMILISCIFYVVTGDPNSNPHGQSAKSREGVYQERDTIYANAELSNTLI